MEWARRARPGNDLALYVDRHASDHTMRGANPGYVRGQSAQLHPWTNLLDRRHKLRRISNDAEGRAGRSARRGKLRLLRRRLQSHPMSGDDFDENSMTKRERIAWSFIAVILLVAIIAYLLFGP